MVFFATTHFIVFIVRFVFCRLGKREEGGTSEGDYGGHRYGLSFGPLYTEHLRVGVVMFCVISSYLNLDSLLSNY